MKREPPLLPASRQMTSPVARPLPADQSGQHLRVGSPPASKAEFEPCDPVSFVKRVESGLEQELLLANALACARERETAIVELKQQVSILNEELVAMATLLHQRQTMIENLHRQVSETKQGASMPGAPTAPHERGTKPRNTEASPPLSTGAAYPGLQHVSVALRSERPPSADSIPPSRRRAPRRACELDLEFTEDTHFYTGITQDLSQGGVFIATYRLFPVGSRLDLAFELPDGTLVKAGGQVRWLRDAAPDHRSRPGMGVAFTELPEESLAALARFCNERAPLYIEL